MDNKKERLGSEYLFLFSVGIIYIFSLTRMIIASTVIRMPMGTLLVMAFVSMLIIMLALHNYITRLITLAVFLIVCLSVLFTLDTLYDSRFYHFYEVYLMTVGRISHSYALGRTAVWIISILLAFTVVVFMFHQFNFFVLVTSGVAILIFTWSPNFIIRDETAFLLFLFSFCLILIRRLTKSTATLMITAPLCIVLVILSQSRIIPQQSELFERRDVRESREGPLMFVSDLLFELFNPTYFSFQTTGFSGAGGRLGGPVTLNNRPVMTVNAPGRTYLTGAISNTYTGFSWTPTLQHGDVYTHGLPPGQFEMLETMVALIRNATVYSTNPSPLSTRINDFLSIEDQRGVRANEFAPIGTIMMEQFDSENLIEIVRLSYRHTYMPMEVITIGLGANRTGSVFTPSRMRRLWFYSGSNDYFPSIGIAPTGHMRTPSMMSRNTSYFIEFLNVNPQLPFVEYIINQASTGVYQSRVYGGQRATTFGAIETNTWEQQNDELYFPDINRTREELNVFVDGILFEWNNIEGVAGVSIALEGDIFQIPPSISDRNLLTFDIENLTVQDMQILVDAYASGREGWRNISYLQGGDAYLIEILNAFSVNILAPYAEQIREHFMYVPEIVPQRVWDLTNEIISNYATDFDRVMAIRNFLLQFPYTLTPVPVPRGVCFVDHFLFEGQEGYCTYFASAMAVMSRIAGIPSRYVEGFLLPPAVGNTNILVTNRMAHAWVEVYLEGFGWLIVEATPTYAFLMNPEVPVRPDGIFSAGFQGDDRFWADWEVEVYFNGVWGSSTGTGGGATTVVADVYEPSFQITIFHIRVAVIFILASMFIIAFGFIMRRRWSVHSKLYHVKELSPNEQVITYFNGIFNIVTYYTTKPLKVDETPKVYGTHMGKRFAFKSDSVFFRDLINLYYKAKYSNETVSEAERALMESAYYDMVNLLKQMRTRPRFFYLRYIKRVGDL